MLRLGPSAAVLTFVAASIAPPAAAQTPVAQPFTWRIESRLLQDGDNGLIRYAIPPEEAAHQKYVVHLDVPSARCRADEDYRWAIDGDEVAEGEGRCHHRHEFDAEGAHTVTLEVGDADPVARDVVVQDWLIVAIGDSVASGEGNPEVPRAGIKRAGWRDRRCHRSALAGVAHAARRLEGEDGTTSVTFVHLACSGATIRKGLTGKYKGIEKSSTGEKIELETQISELAKLAPRREIDAVLVSIGANDVHFSKVVTFCIFHRRCIGKRFNPDHPLLPIAIGQPRMHEVVAGALGKLGAEYAHLSSELDKAGIYGRVPRDRVYLTEYFDPTHDSHGQLCSRILGSRVAPGFGITEGEARYARDRLLARLNEEVRLAAAAHRWSRIGGVAEVFRQHGYCAGGEAWVRTLSESIATHGGPPSAARIAGALHPNERGHEEIGRLIADRLDEDFHSGPLAPLPAPEPSGGGGGGDGDIDVGDVLAVGGTVIGLGAAGAGGRALLRRRRRDKGGEEEQDLGGEPPAPPARPLNAVTVDPGGDDDAAGLLASPETWVLRRRERIDIGDEGSFRHTVTVDLTVPPSLPATGPDMRWMPVARVPKDAVAAAEVTAGDGTRLPVLDRASSHGLVARAAEALSPEASSPDVREDILAVLSTDPVQAEEAWLRLVAQVDRGLADFVAQFRDSETLWVPAGEPGEALTVQLAYPGRRVPLPSWPRRLLSGWAPVRLPVSTTQPGDARDYELSAPAPRGMRPLAATLLAWLEPSQPTVVGGTVVGEAARVALPPGLPTSAVTATITHRLRSHWTLAVMTLVAGLIAAFLGSLAIWTDELSDVGAELFWPLAFVAPALTALAFGRREEHPFTARVALPSRLLVAAAVGSYVIASILLIAELGDDARSVLSVLACVSLAAFAALFWYAARWVYAALG